MPPARLAPLLTFLPPGGTGTGAPILSTIQAIDITQTSVVISWVTNVPATTRVNYGTTAAYGSNTPLVTALTLAHSQLITGLTPSTLYHFRVRSVGANGVEVVSGDATFTTQASFSDVTPPVISNIQETNLTGTSVTISWSLDEFATGQIEYGLTTAYGQFSTLEPSFIYQAHSQTLSSLTPGQTYHYRVRSQDAAGNLAVSADQEFTTTPVAVQTGRYGAGIGMDGLGNLRVGFGGQQWSMRFKASQSSAISQFRVYIIFNGNTGYSNGTGGTLRCRLRADDGTANHFPTGPALATGSITPDNPSTIGGFPIITLSPAVQLVAGQIYHLHFDNTDASPTVNYGSLDFVWYEQVPASGWQPKYPGDEWRVVGTTDGSSWSYDTRATPIIDIAYANGVHDGIGYMEISYQSGEYGIVAGTSNMIREAFTVSGGNKVVTGAGVRLWRHSGTGDVTLRLETSGGTLIEAVTIPGTTFETEANPPPAALDNGSGSGSWGYAAFATPRTLANGSSYNLRVSCPAGSEYRMTVIRKGSPYGFTAATYFSDGVSQKTTDGTNWSSLGRVNNQNDMQFYFTTQ